MSKRQFKSQASSARAASGAFGGGFQSPGLGASRFGAIPSTLSYVAEPPDLTAISDPNLVVAFKNLLKKDSVTKAKALEDLQAYVLSEAVESGGLEDSVLEAWIKIYPRTSIDSSRRVRQLAHTLQGQIAVSCGKRVARHVPRFIGAWLGGLYDNDRIVSRAAQDSLKQVFPSQEKIHNVWRSYARPILEYCRDALLRETVQTLSDERNISPDEANTKYAALVDTSLSVITNLLIGLSPEDNAKQEELYREILSDEKVWGLASSKDALVRRSIYKLLRIALSHQSELALKNISIISTCVLAKSLNIDQTGSAYEYSETLLSLTKISPIVWTEAYTAKRPAITRFQQLLKRGSQGGPPEYWNNVSKIIEQLPQKVLPNDSMVAKDLLGTMRDGILRRDEPRGNVTAAWSAYATMVFRLLALIQSEEDQRLLLDEAVFPLFDGYIRPTTVQPSWSVGPQGQAICSSIFYKMYQVHSEAVRQGLMQKWRDLAEGVIEDIKISLPEQSKNYYKSQEDLSAEGKKWFSLEAAILKATTDGTILALFTETSNMILRNAVDVLRSRNGKPYGAAALIVAALRSQSAQHVKAIKNSNIISPFVSDDLPTLILSPSSQYLLDVLYEFGDFPEFGTAWNATLRNLLDVQDSPAKLRALQRLLMLSKFNCHIDEALKGHLEAYISKNFHQAMAGNLERWELVNKALSLDTGLISPDTTDRMLSELIDTLSIEEKASAALQGLDLLAKESSARIKTLVPTNHGSKLLSNLLFLTESSNDATAELASTVSASIESILSNDQEASLISKSLLAIINRGIDEADINSISIESLVDRARKLLEQASESERSTVARQLLPDSVQWAAGARPYLMVRPNPSFAVTSPLGGAVNMVHHTAGSVSPTDVTQLSHDSEGYSAALRMAWYTSSLLKETNLFSTIGEEQRTEVFQNLALIAQLADDNLSVAGSNHLWVTYTPEVESQMLDFISDTQSLISKWLETFHGDTDSPLRGGMLDKIQTLFANDSLGTSALAYYNARALSVITTQLLEMQRQSKEGPSLRWDGTVRELRKSKDVFFTTAFLTSLSIHMSTQFDTSKLCNELVADLTGLNLSQDTDEGLRQLILLNILVRHYEDILPEVPQQRLVFLVKAVTSWLSQEFTPKAVITEVLKLVTTVLPILKDIYGSHWSDTLNFVAQMWSTVGVFSDEQLPVFHASLRLFTVIKTLAGDDANDDLVDAWQEGKDPMWKGMTKLLKQARSIPDDQHQPLKIVNELLCRQIASMPLDMLENPAELYPLLYVESRAIQQGSFRLLQQQIIAAQEQISFDAALSKKDAHLPAELLSLILEAPTLDSLADASFERTMPLPLRGYLFSWLLIFSHFTNSSFKVKSDYIANLKEGGYLAGLLDFTFDFLGHATRKPVDASKFDITTYDSNNDEMPERDTQWLLIHLYYLSLHHIPSLAKNWWLDCKSRQVKLAVETWTEKYISPLIVAGELANVSAWAPTQEGEDTLQVKVSSKAQEVSVGYEIDEQVMKIVIRLPGAYPLHLASVEGIQRVGVDERKWRSWLIITQGVIAFSNGNLIDGMTAWRKNVRGAIKGQTECAICYSIISADKQLPTKRCGTCKNMFHSDCLYKWFRSSNGSTCPLCRNQFNYDK